MIKPTNNIRRDSVDYPRVFYYYEDDDHLMYLADQYQITKEPQKNNHNWKQEGF